MVLIFYPCKSFASSTRELESTSAPNGVHPNLGTHRLGERLLTN